MKSAAWLRMAILLVLTIIAIVSSFVPVLWMGQKWGDLLLGFGTNMAGAVVTYLLIDLLIRRREEREARKADLIAQLGSEAHDVAVRAVEELRRHGWLYDGSLQGASLVGANLQGARLSGADLQGVNLTGARLQGAYLDNANLQGAILSGANLQLADLAQANLQWAHLAFVSLQDARLGDANLQEATLIKANLQGAYLDNANLQAATLIRANFQGALLIKADLRWADLQRADVARAICDENTILPDGTKWIQGTDLARFTDPGHPNFWSPHEQREASREKPRQESAGGDGER